MGAVVALVLVALGFALGGGKTAPWLVDVCIGAAILALSVALADWYRRR